jgi:hypothetical protein
MEKQEYHNDKIVKSILDEILLTVFCETLAFMSYVSVYVNGIRCKDISMSSKFGKVYIILNSSGFLNFIV